MPGHQDANIKLLYAADDGTFFTADTVANGAPFDIIANVEIGKTLMNTVLRDYPSPVFMDAETNSA